MRSNAGGVACKPGLGIPFWGEGMYVSLSKRKIEIGSIILELNPELWKTGGLPQTL